MQVGPPLPRCIFLQKQRGERKKAKFFFLGISRIEEFFEEKKLQLIRVSPHLRRHHRTLLHHAMFLESVGATISSTTTTTEYSEDGRFTSSVSPPGCCLLAFYYRISLGSVCNGWIFCIIPGGNKKYKILFVSVDWIIWLDWQRLCLRQYHQL